jgi:hypothetical protein
MVKLIVLVKPKEGIDLDTFWDYWSKNWAPAHVTPEIKKYTISRITEVNIGPADKIWGLAELWYDSREAHWQQKDHDLVHGAHGAEELPQDDFHDKLAWRSAYWVEENILFEEGFEERLRDGKAMVKLVAPLQLKEEVDRDEYWKFWVETWGPSHLAPGVRKYALNRVTEVEAGPPDKIWGLAEFWYDSKEAHEADRPFILNRRRGDPELQRAAEKFQTSKSWSLAAFTDEKIIIK